MRDLQDRLGDRGSKPKILSSWVLLLVRAGKPADGARDSGTKATKSGRRSSRAARSPDAAIRCGMQRLDEAAAGGSQAGAPARMGSTRPSLAWRDPGACSTNPKGAVEAIRQGFDLDPKAKGRSICGPITIASCWREACSNSAEPKPRPSRPCRRHRRTAGRKPTDPESNWLLSRAYLAGGSGRGRLRRAERSGSYRADNPLVPEPSPYVGACSMCFVPSQGSPLTRPQPPRPHFSSRARASRSAVPRPSAGRPRRSQGHAHVRARSRSHPGRNPRWRSAFSKTVVEYAFGIARALRDDDRSGRRARLTGAAAVVVPHSRRPLAGDRTAGDVRRLRLARKHPRRADRRVATASSAASTATSPTFAISATRRPRPDSVPRRPMPASAANGATGPAGTTGGDQGRFPGPRDRQHR